jgi:hypothetical protein
MRIIDAEPQLLRDILLEIDVADSKDRTDYSVYAGRHEMLGRMVVVVERDGSGLLIELD